MMPFNQVPQCAWILPLCLSLRLHPGPRRPALHGPQRVRVRGQQLPLRLQEHHRHVHVRLSGRLQEGRSDGRVRGHRRVRGKPERLLRWWNLRQHPRGLHLRVQVR